MLSDREINFENKKKCFRFIILFRSSHITHNILRDAISSVAKLLTKLNYEYGRWMSSDEITDGMRSFK